jgi:putative ABC transport system ATP-binding protein
MTSNAQSAIGAHAPASSAPVVFDVRDLTKVYRTGEVEVYALRGANAQLHEGEISVLLGPSGSGKSTFLNILGGLDEPTSGTVFFDGQDLSGFSRHQLTLYRREHVGFVFQFYNLISSLTAHENVALVTKISHQLE